MLSYIKSNDPSATVSANEFKPFLTTAQIIVPIDEENPDLCYFSDGVLWVFSVEQSVDGGEAYAATDVNKFASVTHHYHANANPIELQQASDSQVKYWQLLTELHSIGTLKHIMRVHICYHANLKECSPIITQSKIGNTNTYIDTTILDITLDKIKSCKLFSSQFSAMIISMHKKRKCEARNLDEGQPNKTPRKKAKK